MGGRERNYQRHQRDHILPHATCNLTWILNFLWRANGSPDPTETNPFTDIKTTDYFYEAALWTAEKGLVFGSTFGANTDCTRTMMMEYMWKAARSPAPAGKADFTDVPANADYAQAVAWAVENKITSGTGGSNFSPATTCTPGRLLCSCIALWESKAGRFLITDSI